MEVLRPASTDEVAAAVKTAAEQGKKLKAVGSGHSFTGCSVPEQVMIRLDGLSSITSRRPDVRPGHARRRHRAGAS